MARAADTLGMMAPLLFLYELGFGDLDELVMLLELFEAEAKA